MGSAFAAPVASITSPFGAEGSRMRSRYVPQVPLSLRPDHTGPGGGLYGHFAYPTISNPTACTSSYIATMFAGGMSDWRAWEGPRM